MAHSRWSAVAVVVGTCSVAACGGGGLPVPGGGSSSSSGGTVTRTAGQAYKDFLLASCALEERCANTRGRSYSSRAACEAFINELDALYRTIGEPGYFSQWDADFEVPDQAKAQRCLDHFATVACTDPDIRNADCTDAVVARNIVAVGLECGGDLGSATYCGSTAHCAEKVEGEDKCTVCKADLADGQSCDTGAECTSGFCAGGTFTTKGTCSAPAAKTQGQTCARDSECLGNLVCVGSGSNGTCQARGGSGASCDGPEATSTTRPPCQNDLSCITDAAGVVGTCTANLADGQPCSRESFDGINTAAVCNHFCVPSAVDSATGTCSMPGSPPSTGGACVGYQGGFTAICNTGDDTVYADYTVVISGSSFNITGCTCKTKVANAASCFFDEGCVSGNCENPNFQMMTAGTCAPKLSNGETCTQDSQCDSDNCVRGAQSGTCNARVVCP